MTMTAKYRLRANADEASPVSIELTAPFWLWRRLHTALNQQGAPEHMQPVAVCLARTLATVESVTAPPPPSHEDLW